MIEQRKYYDIVRFYFPSHQFMSCCKHVMNLQKLEELIFELWRYNKYLFAQVFPIKMKKKKDQFIFYCQSYKCKFELVFTEMTELNFFRLAKFNNEHNHRKDNPQNQKIKKMQLKKQLDFIENDEYLDRNFENFTQSERFRLNVEKLQKKCFRQSSIMHLYFKNNTIQSNDIETFFFSTAEMQEEFKNNNLVICIEKLKNKWISSLDFYLFYSINNELKVKIFAFTLTQTKEKAIQFLMKLEGFEKYQTIIIQEDEELKNILIEKRKTNNLNYEIYLRLNSQNKKKSIQRIQIQSLLFRLCTCTSDVNFGVLLQSALKIPKLSFSVYEILDSFIKNKQFYCLLFSKRRTFIGRNLQIRLDKGQILKKIQQIYPSFCSNDEKIQIFRGLSNAIGKVNFVQFSEELDPQIKKQFQSIHFFRSISTLLTNQGLKIISEQVRESFLFNMNEGQNQFFVSSTSQSFIVQKQEGKWDCQCGFSHFFALPCRHMIKVFLKKEYNYIKCIDDYWKKKII